MKKITSIFLLLIFFTSAMVASDDNQEKKITELTSADYQKKISSGIVLVDFWAAWCAPCLKQAPVLEELVKDSLLQIRVGKLDIEEHKAFAIEKGINSIPTLILYSEGKEIKRFVGLQQKDKLKEKIMKALATDNK